MTEAYKLSIFIHIDEETSLRTVFVCDTESEELKQELTSFVKNMLSQFKGREIPDAIDVCETDMFSRLSKFIFTSSGLFRHGRGHECDHLQHNGRAIHSV